MVLYKKYFEQLSASIASRRQGSERVIKMISLMGCIILLTLLIHETIRVGNSVEPLGDPGYVFRLLRIFVVFLLTAACIWKFSKISIILSIPAQLWVLGEYIMWYVESRKGMYMAGITRLPEPSTLGFYRATWLGVVPLFLAISILIMWLAVLFRGFSKSKF